MQHYSKWYRLLLDILFSGIIGLYEKSTMRRSAVSEVPMIDINDILNALGPSYVYISPLRFA